MLRLFKHFAAALFGVLLTLAPAWAQDTGKERVFHCPATGP